MGAKFSVLPQRNKTNAQMSERDTLAKYCERLTLVGLQLSALRLRLRLRLRLWLRRSCGCAVAARFEFRAGRMTTPLSQE